MQGCMGEGGRGSSRCIGGDCLARAEKQKHKVLS